jgi:type II secretory pathway pseudopilin PulG
MSETMMRRHQHRNGYILFEALTAVTLLGILLAAFAPVLTLSIQVFKDSSRRVVALEEAANVAERLVRTPWTDLTADHLAEWALSPEAANHLPDGKLAVTLSESADEPDAKRFVIQVDWSTNSTRPRHKVRLETWRFIPPEGRP